MFRRLIECSLPPHQTAYKQNNFTEGEFPSFSNEFAADPFAGEDPFANESAGAKQDDLFANDAFANAFGKSNTDVGIFLSFSFTSDILSHMLTCYSDLFQDFNDPFSSRSNYNESTPELPPKKSGPPPRPAPPKTSKPQPKANADPWGMQPAAAETDPFASNASTQQGDGFANFDEFANFDQV